MKAADCVFRRNGASVPRWLGFGSHGADECQACAVRISEGQNWLAKTLLQRLMRNAFLDEPMRPVSNRSYGDAKRRLLRKTHARTSWLRVLPRKKGENGTRMANPITVVEMI